MKLNKSLPNSLTKENQDILLNQYLKNGNFEARQKLIIHNLKLISFIIKTKFDNSSYTDNDLFDAGIIGLIKAVDTFDLEKKVAFSTYATKCIYTEILKYITLQNKIKEHEISIETPIPEYNDSDLTIFDSLSDGSTNIEAEYDKIEQTEFINEMLEPLSDKEKLIISLRFELNNYHPHEVSEIAKINNLSRQEIYNILNKALAKIKKNMADYYRVKRAERRNALKRYYDSISSKKFNI